MKPEERIGMRFGILEVKCIERGKYGKVYVCRCDCGKPSRQTGSNLFRVKSCGCIGHRTHGMTNRPEYAVWEAIVQRCTNKRHKNYADYGGRGIKLHPLWRKDFAAFYAEVGPRPKPVAGKRWTIERKKNARGYVPGNVAWALDNAQSRNRRNNRWLTFRGEKLVMLDMARKYGISHSQLYKRIADGWTLRRALLTPTRMIGRKVWAARQSE